MALDLNRSPPYDEELLPDLNNPVVDEELLQQDHNLDGAEFAGRQQQLISPGNYSWLNLSKLLNTIWFLHEQLLQLHYLNLLSSAIDQHKPVEGGEALPDFNEQPANVEEFYQIKEAQANNLGNELSLQQYILDIVRHNFFNVPV